MKTKAWLFILTGGIFSAIIFPTVCAVGAFPFPSLADIGGPFLPDCAVTQFVQYRPNEPLVIVHGRIYSLCDEDLADPLAEALDSQPDDDSRADGNKFATVVHDESSRCDLSKLPAGWRLLQPDTKRTNSFIHSKAKPPPHNYNHRL